MAQLSTYLANALANALLRNLAYSSPAQTYLALHTADPTAAALNELPESATDYSRQAIDWTAVADARSRNSNAPAFANVGAVATGSIQSVAGSGIIEGEQFVLDDGVNPAVTFEFDRVEFATGSIDSVAGSQLVEGEQFVLNDGVNPAVTFEFDELAFATGSITAVAGASLIDGEQFVLDDGVNPAVTFEFDDDSSVVETSTLRQVFFSAGLTDAQVAESIGNAIAGAPALDISAASGGGALINLTADNYGTQANNAITETVVDAGFVVTGMAGGLGLTTVETATLRAVGFTAADSAVTVGFAMAAAINLAPALDLTASGGSVVNITADNFGTQANNAITETVADVGFVVAGMSEGLGLTTTQTPTLRAVLYSASYNTTAMGAAIASAINSAPTLDITATPAGAGLVNLANDTIGIQGNVAITETVADVGFTVTGMAGGSGDWGAVTHWGLWDAASSGNMLFFGPLWNTGGSYAVGDTLTVHANALHISMYPESPLRGTWAPTAALPRYYTGRIEPLIADAMLAAVLNETGGTYVGPATVYAGFYHGTAWATPGEPGIPATTVEPTPEPNTVVQGSITAVAGANLIDGENFFIDDAYNAGVTFEFDTVAYATGSITAVAGANLNDGETFVLNDGVNPAVTFEFDNNGTVVETSTLRQVVFSAGLTDAQVAEAIGNAIAGAPALDISAASGGGALINLTADNFGTQANNAITETVTDAGFVVTGMAGGADPALVETDTLRAVGFTAADSAITVAATIATAMTNAPAFDYTPTAPGDGTVTFSHSRLTGTVARLNSDLGTPGASEDWAETVVDGGFALIGPSGGTGDTHAFGFLTTVAAASLVDGETFTLKDGTNTVVFEFDNNASVVESPTLRAVTYAGGESATAMRDLIIEAINDAQGLGYIDIFASAWATATARLVNDNATGDGNQVLSETVTDAGFILGNMENGETMYARQAVAFDDVVAGVTQNTADVVFGPYRDEWDQTTGFEYFLGLFDAASGGNLLMVTGSPLPASQKTTANETQTYPSGTVSIGFS